jgi:FixJ family two-component response regulator
VTEASPATIFLIDTDEPFVRLVFVLGASMRTPVRVFDSGAQFLRQFDPEEPGCLVLEMRLPDLSGLDLQERLSHEPIAPPVIFVTAHADVGAVVRAKRQGAFRFLTKQGFSETELWEAIISALAQDREARICHQRRRALAARLETLTSSERRTFDMLLDGQSMMAIAAALGIGRRTAESHRMRILKKLGLDNLAELVRFGVDAGVFPPERETPRQ